MRTAHHQNRSLNYNNFTINPDTNTKNGVCPLLARVTVGCALRTINRFLNYNNFTINPETNAEAILTVTNPATSIFGRNSPSR